MSKYKDVKEWRKFQKHKLVTAFGGFCAICKIEDHPIVYDFHHIDPSKKDFTISSRIVSWQRTVDEASKCVMLCGGCHRKVHGGIVEVPHNSPKFNEALIETEMPDLLFDACNGCGGKKKKSARYCSLICAGKHQNQRSKVNWEKYDLLEMYQRLGSYLGVAQEIGNISDMTVRRRMKIKSS